jgi:ABC-type multidrug transport system fused ATPase/permease subunit
LSFVKRVPAGYSPTVHRPIDDPGRPELRSPLLFFRWIARQHLRLIASGSALLVAAMGARSFIPACVGLAVDALVAGGPGRAFAGWVAAVAALGAVGGVASVFGHRVGVFTRLAGGFTVQRLTIRHVAWLGDAMHRRVAAGDAVALSGIEAANLGFALTALANGFGAVASVGIIAVLLVNLSPTLGWLVVAGVPLVMAALAAFAPPLERRQREVGATLGQAATIAGDVAVGLRILRGIGGEATMLDRYRHASERVRLAAVRSARLQSMMDASQVLLPGALMVVVTWLGARAALAGRITPGELTAFYGYAAFLFLPVTAATEAVVTVTRGLASAHRVHALLSLRRDLPEPEIALPAPASAAELVDPDYGLTVRPGSLTGVVCLEPADAASLAGRLAGYVEADVRLGGVPLRRLPSTDVRRRVMLVDPAPVLFAGTLREALNPPRAGVGIDPQRALAAACAGDILAAAAAGWDTRVTEQGRSLSMGQRQRLALARAIVADPEILVLDEPTSALDALTEARVADALGAVRRGRTTVVLTHSPLVLDRTDRVLLVVGGRVVADQSHAELVRCDARYRAWVTRATAGDTQSPNGAA